MRGERRAEIGGGQAGPELVPIERADLAVLEHLVRSYYAEDGLVFDERRQRNALALLVEDGALARGWLVRLGGQVVGYVVLTWSFSIESGGRDGYIDELFLTADVRGQGLGARVLALAEVAARDLGLGRLYLEVEHGNRAVNLYRRAGFVDHHRYLMSKRLVP